MVESARRARVGMIEISRSPPLESVIKEPMREAPTQVAAVAAELGSIVYPTALVVPVSWLVETRNSISPAAPLFRRLDTHVSVTTAVLSRFGVNVPSVAVRMPEVTTVLASGTAYSLVLAVMVQEVLLPSAAHKS